MLYHTAEHNSKKEQWRSEIGAVYRELIAALVTRPFERKHSMVSYPVSGEKNVVLQSSGEHLEEELYHLLKTQQISGAVHLIFEKTDLARSGERGWTYLEVRQYVGRITNTIFSYVQKEQPQLHGMIEEAMDNVDYYLKCLNGEKLSETLKIMVEGLREQKEQQQPDSVAGQIERIRPPD